MDAGNIRVSSAGSDPVSVITVSGELTLATEGEFTARVQEALAATPGPVLFDVSGLDFVDCRGARALAKAVRAVPPREARLHGCSPAIRRVLDAVALDLPHAPQLTSQIPPRPRPRAHAGAPSRGEAMTAMTHAAQSSARQSALYASEVMSRLATTYSELALNSLYRTQRKSEERGRLLALSGRALDLSRRYMRHAAGDVG